MTKASEYICLVEGREIPWKYVDYNQQSPVFHRHSTYEAAKAEAVRLAKANQKNVNVFRMVASAEVKVKTSVEVVVRTIKKAKKMVSAPLGKGPWIIVKYAENYIGSKVPAENAYSGYSCNRTGVAPKRVYYSMNHQARHDLKKLQQYNPSVGFGFVECL